MTLSQLINRPMPGKDSGTCQFCHRQTEQGWKGPPSDKFTAFAATYGGDVVCEFCKGLLDHSFRTHSWLATLGSVTFISKENRAEAWTQFLHPPAPPFAWYLTRSGQKQGWLTLMRYVSSSQEQFFVGTDFTDRPVLMSVAWLRDVSPLLLRLRERNVKKAALAAGQFSASQTMRAMNEGWMEDLRAAQSFAGDPRWEVSLLACP